MTKATTQSLNLTNPWDAQPRHSSAAPMATPGATSQSAPLAARAKVSDHFNTDPLPTEMHQRLARTSNPKELARAFAARILDTHDRCMIFRHRLADQFPEAASLVNGFDLPEHHDYTKMLEFMDNGRWPKGTSNELVQLYPRLIHPMLTHLDAAWKAQAHHEAADVSQKQGLDPSSHSSHIEQSVGVVCDAIHLAHLQGARALHLSGHPALLSLPPHLASLRQLQHLTLSHLGIHTLPHSLGQLKHLESLRLHDLASLEAVPESLGELPSLKQVVISGTSPQATLKLPASLARLAQKSYG